MKIIRSENGVCWMSYFDGLIAINSDEKKAQLALAYQPGFFVGAMGLLCSQRGV